MAIKDQVDVLESGVETWNEWRREGQLKPDLTGCVIKNRNLNGIDLSGADLREARFINTTLRDADMSSAFLCQASFAGCDLSGCDLRNADLSRANLDDATLVGGKLDRAHLDSVSMERANASNAVLSYVNLNNVNASDTNFAGSNLEHATIQDALLDRANFTSAKLDGAILTRSRGFEAVFLGANLSNINLCDSDLYGANFTKAKIDDASLTGANLELASFTKATLTNSNLDRSNLFEAGLNQAVLRAATLKHADLSLATLVSTDLSDADISGCSVFGVSAWGLALDGAKQKDLVIRLNESQPGITIDNIEVAQFVYLLLHNEKIRQVLDTLTSKTVLILGRFSDERKSILDAIRDTLREYDFTPVLVDFASPESRDLTETVSTLAHMARFVIADITDARSIPQELQRIVPNLPSVAVQPVILESQAEYAMFKDFGGYYSVLAPFRYRDEEHLLDSLENHVISPALDRVRTIDARRAEFEEQLSRQ